jgi:hypothetical protein
LDRPTFFTLDEDFFDRRLCHEGYCLAYLDIDEDAVADYAHRLLRQRAFKSKTKRMGRVIGARSAGLTVWLIHEKQEDWFSWD